MQGPDLGFCPLTLPEHAAGAIQLCGASGTWPISPFGAAVQPRGEAATASAKAVRGWVDGMASTLRIVVYAVTSNEPKALGRKAEGSRTRPGAGEFAAPVADVVVAGGKTRPNPSVGCVRNVVSPYFSLLGQRAVRRAHGSAGR